MTGQRSKGRAFTIVEVLVVIAIIGILLGLLLPALGAVKRRSRKTSEANSLKQVAHAWMLYANYSNDAALPGYLETAVQAPRVQGVSRGWGVKYDYPDQRMIHPAPTYQLGDPNVAGPWTWRLLPYLEFSHDIVHGYDVDDGDDFVSISHDPVRALNVALTPAFGYNGYYVGGYWRMHPDPGNPATKSPFFDFYDHCEMINGAGTGPRVSIATTISQINRSTDVIVFCSSTRVVSPGIQYRFEDTRPGSYLVTPPFLGPTAQWQPDPMGERDHIEALAPDVHVPMGRHTGAVVSLYADGDIETLRKRRIVA